MKDQQWFEMHDLRRKKLVKSSWVALRATQNLDEKGEYGHVEYLEEYRAVASVAVPVKYHDEARKLGWESINTNRSHSAWAQKNHYTAADVFEFPQVETLGVPLVLEQSFDGEARTVWHLHQDLVIALELQREDDSWICPKEGFAEVARLKRQDDGDPVLLEIRTEFLVDYLCARHMGLRLCRYHCRREIVSDSSQISWPDDHAVSEQSEERWEGYFREIEGGGGFFDGAVSVMVVSRTNEDFKDDVPVVGWPGDGDVETTQFTRQSNRPFLTMVVGECWLDEWLEPGKNSPRVRGDDVPAIVQFIVDEQGARETKATLESSVRWLWFRPEIIAEVSHRRGGQLGWYTRDTGSVGCTRHGKVHFGVNKLGLINVFAKDIVLLPEWQQRIWAGMNISPDGGVCEELIDSQMRCQPADTRAPEIRFYSSMEALNRLFVDKLGEPLFRDHDDRYNILERTHRFRATNREELCSLAKDVARVTADSIDCGVLRQLLTPPKNEKWGSLKHLEKYLGTVIDPGQARSMCTPLVAAYELRHGDAHLPGDLTDKFTMVGIDEQDPVVLQGAKLLEQCAESIEGVVEILRSNWEENPTK